ncbi:MAG: polysaccharide deacetylase [Gemmobacter sp.]
MPAEPREAAEESGGETAWAVLGVELDRWRAASLTLPLWWRDDDAVEPSPALDALLARAEAWGLPVAVAAIPAAATPALAARLAASLAARPMVHGWAHANHEPPDAKRAEFGAARPPAAALADAARGLGRMRALFGPRLLPVLVPPWNRIAPAVATGLAACGFAGLSAVPKAAGAARGLARLDIHIDPIDWHGTRSALPAARLALPLAALLAARRAAADFAPLGLLTHHRDHDPAIWAATDRLVAMLLDGVAVPFDAAAGFGTLPRPRQPAP